MALFTPSDALDEQAIRDALAQVSDPDIGKSLAELEALHSVEIKGSKVKVYLKLIQPLHLVAKQIDLACQKAIHSIAADAKVQVFVQEQAPERPAGTAILQGVKNLIAVASGKGGVGKSTVAANLAVALAQQGASVGLVDADIHGPSVPTMFGLQGEELRARKTDDGRVMGYPHERHGVKVASIGFVMGRDQAAVMRGPMQAGYFSTLIEQIHWGELDYLLFDLPPGTGDIQLTLSQKVPLTGAVIVTTPQDISLADVRRGISMFNKVNVDVLGVIENMSYFSCPACGHREEIFSHGGGHSIADELEVPFLGELPLASKVRHGGDDGKPVVLDDDAKNEAEFITGIAQNVVTEVRRNNLRAMATPTVQISL